MSKIHEILESGQCPTVHMFKPSTLIFGFGRKGNLKGHATANQWKGVSDLKGKKKGGKKCK